RERLGTTPVIGASTQGVIGQGQVIEDGYAAGAIAFGGIAATTGCVEALPVDTRAKGRALGEQLGKPELGILHYDPLSNADIDQLLAGLYDVVRCPIVGGAAGAAWGPMTRTWQYYGTRVLHHAAVATGLAGDGFGFELAICHGTTPIGIEMT